MRKITCLLICLLSILCLGACGRTAEEVVVETTEEDIVEFIAPTKEAGLSDKAIERIVVRALIDEIDKNFDYADAGSCTYGINTIERTSWSINVYGSVTLYDKYGKVTKTPYRTFEVAVSSGGRVIECKIK